MRGYMRTYTRLYIYIYVYIQQKNGIQRDREKKREKESQRARMWLWGSNGHLELVIFLSFSHHIYIYPPLFSRTGRHHSPLPLVTLWVWVAPATLAPLSLIVIIKIPRCPGNQLTSLTLSLTMFLSFQHHHHSTSLGNIYLCIHTHMQLLFVYMIYRHYFCVQSSRFYVQ